MKTFIAILFFALTLTACSIVKIKQAQQETLAWLDMCQLLIDEDVGYACNRLMPPLVVYEEMEEDLLGYYDGSDTIYISDELRGDDRLDVLIHESIHYVHAQHGIIIVPGPAKEICWSENEAWRLTGIYFDRDYSRWWRSYRHCWQYYGTSQELRDIGYIYNEIEDIIDGIIFED